MPDERQTGADATALFSEHRPYLFAVAYRLLGVAEDAEDVLQEAWIRFREAPAGDLERPRSYLVAIVTRLCIDFLRSARLRREEYVGIWLPEPVPTREASADDLLADAESASFAFLLLLEQLSPLERVVLVLYDVFEYSHEEVSAMIHRSAVASRQVLRRARLKLGRATRPRTPPPAAARDLVERFVAAARSGDIEGFVGALAPDVVFLSDGGGKVAAVPRPLAGNARVGRFLGVVSREGGWESVIPTELNAQPALLIYDNGLLINAILLDLTDAGVTAVYVVRNPDKLRRLVRLSAEGPG